ncbi:enoyl-CoA hydratase/isomerase family protein [Pseudonocardia acaciae]|uniref:enoyl-CoA hydratase/isomerase family protein n=1 Tax=Pseudonocardia acaciae TaxID=551276 RepID=UPI000560D1A1|nr:enoyl-CoA hydratase/isomerase family protein [Pseudonocardia acaciae]
MNVVDGVLTVLLDRPERRNALDAATVAGLHASVEAAGSDPAVRAVVLGSARPGMFCSGADLRVGDDERAEVSDRLYALYQAMIGLPVPLVAAVDGPAVGGGAQLALACDVRFGSARAGFRFAGPGHGLAVGLWALPSTVGRGAAMELALSGRMLTAERARELGLLEHVVADPLAAATELAAGVAALDRDAVARAKSAVVHGERLASRLAAERAGNAGFTGAVESKLEV